MLAILSACLGHYVPAHASKIPAKSVASDVKTGDSTSFNYSHLRTEAKRRAVDSPVVRPNVAPIPDESAKVNQIK
jgi:hypothetical protein